MSGVNIKADTGKMRNNADELRALAGQYNACTQDVIAAGRALGGMWEGDAKEEFMRILEQDAPEFDRLYQELNKFCDAVVESAATYEQTQQAVVTQMQGTTRR